MDLQTFKNEYKDELQPLPLSRIKKVYINIKGTDTKEDILSRINRIKASYTKEKARQRRIYQHKIKKIIHEQTKENENENKEERPNTQKQNEERQQERERKSREAQLQAQRDALIRQQQEYRLRLQREKEERQRLYIIREQQYKQKIEQEKERIKKQKQEAELKEYSDNLEKRLNEYLKQEEQEENKHKIKKKPKRKIKPQRKIEQPQIKNTNNKINRIFLDEHDIRELKLLKYDIDKIREIRREIRNKIIEKHNNTDYILPPNKHYIDTLLNREEGHFNHCLKFTYAHFFKYKERESIESFEKQLKKILK